MCVAVPEREREARGWMSGRTKMPLSGASLCVHKADVDDINMWRW